MRFFLLALILASSLGWAVELRELSLTYHHFQSYSTFPELGGRNADQGLNLGMNIDIAGPVFWDNTVHYMTSGNDSIYVGWNYRLGMRVFKHLDLGFEHFSQHMIGQPEIPPHFPLYDSIFVEWKVFEAGRKPSSIFQ